MFSDFCSSACGWVSPFGALVFVSRCCRPSASDASRRPRGGRHAGSCCLPVLRVALVSRCGGRFLHSSALLSLLVACLWFYLVFVEFPPGLCIWAFLRHFPSCGVPDLQHVVSAFAARSFPSWRVASEFFSDLRSSRSRRLLRGGAYTDCAEQWSPWILSRSPLPGRSVEEGQVVCSCMSSHRGGNVSTLRVGVRHSAGLSAKELRRALTPRPGKRDHIHTLKAQCHCTNTRVARTHGTRVHVASLALNPRKYVNE